MLNDSISNIQAQPKYEIYGSLQLNLIDSNILSVIMNIHRIFFFSNILSNLMGKTDPYITNSRNFKEFSHNKKIIKNIEYIFLIYSLALL